MVRLSRSTLVLGSERNRHTVCKTLYLQSRTAEIGNIFLKLFLSTSESSEIITLGEKSGSFHMSLNISKPFVMTTSRSQVDTMMPSGNAPATEGESRKMTLQFRLRRRVVFLVHTLTPELVTNIISLTLFIVRTRFESGLQMDTTKSWLLISLLIVAHVSSHCTLYSSMYFVRDSNISSKQGSLHVFWNIL
uniref:Uncharacterized protein n=1 Tax=Cacopsylla melanoneura TaxID=428564 RepID=A0A8D8WEJ4_9HEMI